MSRLRNRRSRRPSSSRTRGQSLGQLRRSIKPLFGPEQLEPRVLLAADLLEMSQAPLVFEVNIGQTDEQFDFVGRGRGYNLSLSSHELLLALNHSIDFDDLPEQDGEGLFNGLEDDPEPVAAPTAPTELRLQLLRRTRRQ